MIDLGWLKISIACFCFYQALGIGVVPDISAVNVIWSECTLTKTLMNRRQRNSKSTVGIVGWNQRWFKERAARA